MSLKTFSRQDTVSWANGDGRCLRHSCVAGANQGPCLMQHDSLAYEHMVSTGVAEQTEENNKEF